MAFVIRDLLKEDRPGWENLWGGYLDFYQAPMDPVVIEVTWSRLLDPEQPMMALVAKDAATHELIGLTHCVFHHGTWAVGEFCYLEDLFVAPTARRQGVARALIEAVYARADARKCERVYWLTHESNTGARRLYDQLAKNMGFIQYRRTQ